MILDARTKGIITMNEMILGYLMKRIQKRRDWMKKRSSEFCPKPLLKLEKCKKQSWLLTIEWYGGDTYKVVWPYRQFVVNKKERSCSCRKWDISGMPCSHGVAVICYNKEDPELYVDYCYKVSILLKTYNNIINPTNGSNLWPKSDFNPILPPQPMKLTRGRKPKLRRKEEDEINTSIRNGRVTRKGSVITCTICGTKGHNKRYHSIQNTTT